MQIAANAKAIARSDAHEDARYQLVGLAIVSLFPALFWTTLIAGVGTAVGQALAPVTLLTIGTAIAVFCAAVGQMVFSRS